MYAKTNPGVGRLTPRQKRVFGVIGVLVVLVIGGLAIWGAAARTAMPARETAA